MDYFPAEADPSHGGSVDHDPWAGIRRVIVHDVVDPAIYVGAVMGSSAATTVGYADKEWLTYQVGRLVTSRVGSTLLEAGDSLPGLGIDVAEGSGLTLLGDLSATALGLSAAAPLAGAALVTLPFAVLVGLEWNSATQYDRWRVAHPGHWARGIAKAHPGWIQDAPAAPAALPTYHNDAAVVAQLVRRREQLVRNLAVAARLHSRAGRAMALLDYSSSYSSGGGVVEVKTQGSQFDASGQGVKRRLHTRSTSGHARGPGSTAARALAWARAHGDIPKPPAGSGSTIYHGPSHNSGTTTTYTGARKDDKEVSKRRRRPNAPAQPRSELSAQTCSHIVTVSPA